LGGEKFRLIKKKKKTQGKRGSGGRGRAVERVSDVINHISKGKVNSS